MRHKKQYFSPGKNFFNFFQKMCNKIGKTPVYIVEGIKRQKRRIFIMKKSISIFMAVALLLLAALPVSAAEPA